MNNFTKFSKSSDRLALMLATTLRDTGNLQFYHNCVRKYSKPLIQRALTEALKVPQEKIKKSRGALFNYLIHLYAHQSHQDSGD